MASTESEQELRTTVAMFEEVIRAQPDDYQSLEILREAYVKLGQTGDVVRIGQHLADVHRRNGQPEDAAREYRRLVELCPDDPEPRRQLDRLTGGSGGESAAIAPELAIRADEELGRILLAEGLILDRVHHEGLQAVREWSQAFGARQPRFSLCQYLYEIQAVESAELLEFLVHRSRMPFVPLQSCDADPALGRRLPREVAFQDLAVLFDVMGPSALVAVANPLHADGLARVEEAIGQKSQFYIADVVEVIDALGAIYSVAQVRAESRMAEV